MKFRWLRILLLIALLPLCITMGYLLWVGFPEPWFSHRFTHNSITVYSDQMLEEETVSEILTLVQSKISQSELYNFDQRYKVYLCHSPRLFRLFNPFHIYAIGVNTSLLNGKTFIRTPLISQNQILDSNREIVPYPKTLANTIAHEITHKMVVDAVGRRAFHNLERWIIEGYAEYIGIGETGYIDISTLVNKETDDMRLIEKYQAYHIVMENMLDQKNLTIEDILTQNIPWEQAFEQLVHDHQSTPAIN